MAAKKPSGEMPTSRLSRLVKLSTLTTQVTASVIGQKARGLFQGEEARASAALATQIKNAQRMADTMGYLKGAVMKVGQMMSLHDGDGIAPEVAAILSRLQNQVPRLPWESVRAHFIASFDRPPEEMFSRFDPEPVAAASLGQVYRAALPDGTPVAVKVQYPGVRDTLQSDLSNLKAMIDATSIVSKRFDTDQIFGEIKTRLTEEADYLNEGYNLQEFARLLSDDERVVIPKYYPEFSSETVLTMEWIEGRGLTQVLEEGLSDDKAQRLARITLDLFMKQLMQLGTLHADPHHGNFLLLADGRIGLLDFGCVKRFDRAWLDGYRALTRATLARDRAQMVEWLVEVGFLHDTHHPRANELLCDITETALTPFLDDAEYNFGTAELHLRFTDLPQRMLALGRSKFPPDALYLNRVFMGQYFLMRKLRARANWHRMLMPYLNS